MPDALDELAEAWEDATPGPWKAWQVAGFTGAYPGIESPSASIVVWGDGDDGDDSGVRTGMPDAHFIALAGTHVGTLLERLRAAEAVCESCRTGTRWGQLFDADALKAWRQLRGTQ
jgi:hypothetical protein